jgi:hypothetical protein
MKHKILDVIGIAIILVGILMTGFLYIATRRPANAFDTESFTIQEIPSPAPQEIPRAPHGRGGV